MLWYAILVTFLLGGLCGACTVILVAVHSTNKENETKRRQAIHPSTREIPSEPTILT